MNKLLKKSLIVILMLVTPIAMASDLEFTVVTSHGEIKCVLPEGYSWENYAKEISILYLEERFANESLLEQAETLNSQIDSYMKEVDSLKEEYKATIEAKDSLIKRHEEKESIYESIIKEKDNLISIEKQRNKIPAIQGIFGVGASMTDSIQVGFSAQGGIILWNNVALQFGVNMFPLNFNLMASFIF